MTYQVLTAWRVLARQRSCGGQGLNCQRSPKGACGSLTMSRLCFRLMMKDKDYLLAVSWRSGQVTWSQDGWTQESSYEMV